MSTTKQIYYLLLTFLAIIVAPYVGAYIKYQGVFPKDYFDFPPLVAAEKSPFNIYIFIALAVFFFLIILLYVFPWIYGFKKVPVKPSPKIENKSMPSWFWLGLLMWGGTLAVLWLKLSGPNFILHWAAVPLFWGFTLVLDGIVYYRTGGKSIIRLHPQELMAVGVASIGGWLIFEYLNFFVDETWVYPFGNILPDSEFTMYAVIGSSGLFPMAFEWYSLFNTFDKLKHRYSNGPKIVFSPSTKYIFLFFFVVILGISSFFPNLFFGMLWIAPLFMFACILGVVHIWSPFTPLRKGDWTPIMLLGLTYFVQGFLCEFWNYFSGYHENGTIITHNPDYWTYSIPYVNVLHVFEMPLLGLQGYIPFGVYAGIWWIVFAYLLRIPNRFNETEYHSI